MVKNKRMDYTMPIYCMKKIIKICSWAIPVIAVACLALMLICNQIVVSNAEGKVFSDIDAIEC